MKVVLDIEMILAAFFKDGMHRKLIKDIIQQHEVIVSDAVLLDYLKTIRLPIFQEQQNSLEKIIILLTDMAINIDAKPCQYRAINPLKQKYLDTAISANADMLLVAHKSDFAKVQYGSTSIM